MKVVFALFFISAAFLQSAYTDIPNVFEFCSALMSEKESSCQRRACPARPGKRGAVGSRGLKGERGEQGPPGQPDALERRVAMLEETVGRMKRSIPEDMQNHCLMGMKSRKIPNAAITASSTYQVNKAYYGRLDEKTTSSSRGVWVAGTNRVGEWLQVDLGATKSVAGIVTQGRPECTCNQWTKTYKVSCGTTVKGLRTITEEGKDKIFTANGDRDTKVVNLFSSPMACRYIRVYPQSWDRHMVLRMDVLDGECFDLLSVIKLQTGA